MFWLNLTIYDLYIYIIFFQDFLLNSNQIFKTINNTIIEIM